MIYFKINETADYGSPYHNGRALRAPIKSSNSGGKLNGPSGAPKGSHT